MITYPKFPAYGLRIIVCGNSEVTQDYDLENYENDERNTDACQAAISAHPEVEVDSFFPNWNGGKYSHQADSYGFKIERSHICSKEVEPDEETLEEDEIMPNSEIKDYMIWLNKVKKEVEDAYTTVLEA